MSEYFACISWARKNNEVFIDNKYSRSHQWEFDGGAVIQASSSPHIVPLPYSCEDNVDPEESFIASISSCHMLFFLSIAAKRGYIVNSYKDDASGILELDNEKKMSITTVTLHPKIEFSGEKKPTLKQIDKIHHLSHIQCFIANSVKTKIVIK